MAELRPYLKQVLQENPEFNIDVREGSAFSTFVLDPMSILMRLLDADLEEVKEGQTILNYETMPDDVMDALAANFSITRAEGNRAQASVRLYYSVPIDVVINEGRIFATAGGLTFSANQRYTLSAADLAARRDEEGFYYTDDIPVTAQEPGEEYLVDVDSIVSMAVAPPELARVTNLNPSTGGSPREDNLALYQRIRDSVATQQVLNQAGTRGAVRQRFPSVTQSRLFGKGDPEMQRDRVFFNPSGDETAAIASFFGKIKNNPDNPSIAYALASGEPLPAIADFRTEVDQTVYAQLAARSDSQVTDFNAGFVFSEDFERAANEFVPAETTLSEDAASGDGSITIADGTNFFRNDIVEISDDTATPAIQRIVIGVTANSLTLSENLNESYDADENAKVKKVFRNENLGNGWIESSHDQALGKEADVKQATIENGILALGKASYATDAQLQNNVAVNTATLTTQVRDLLRQALANTGLDPSGHDDIDSEIDGLTLTALISDIESNLTPASAFPVVQHPLSLHNGIRLTGTMRTNDGTSGGRYSYITVKRDNAASASYYNGFGIAWKKSTKDTAKETTTTAEVEVDDTTIEVSDASDFYTSGAAYLGDIWFTYTGKTATSLTGCDIPINADVATGATVNQAHYNLFITDNGDIVSDANARLARGFAYIQGDSANLTYNFELLFTAPAGGDAGASALDVRIWESSELRPSEATLSYGAYVSSSVVNGSTTAQDFGISVAGCQGYQWYYDDIVIDSVISQYAHHLYRFFDSASQFEDGFRVLSRLKGEGGRTTDAGVVEGGDGAIVHIWNIEDSAWEEVGDNDTTAFVDVESDTALNITPYRNSNGYIYVMASTKYPTLEIYPARLSVDYIALISDRSAGVNIGGKSDLYIKTRERLISEQTTIDAADVTQLIYISEETGFVLPIAVIDAVHTLDINGNPGSPLEEGVDYSFFIGNPDERFSAIEHNALIFSPAAQGTDKLILYKTFPQVQEVQAYLNEAGVRAPDGDWLCRAFRPVFVDVTVLVEGNPTTEPEMSARLSAHLSTLGERLDVSSDVVGFLTGEGVQDVVTPVTVTAEEHLSSGATVDHSSSDSISIDRDARFHPRNVFVVRAES